MATILNRAPRGSASVRISMALWFLLAIVVFNVRFDWQVRAANHAFVRSQIARHQQGQPTLTINEGFRPLVGRAAAEAGVWMAAIGATGAILTALAAARRHTAATN